MNAIDGHQFAESTSRKSKKENAGHWACLPDQTSCFKRSSDKFWKLTTIASSVIIPMGFALDEAVTQR